MRHHLLQLARNGFHCISRVRFDPKTARFSLLEVNRLVRLWRWHKHRQAASKWRLADRCGVCPPALRSSMSIWESTLDVADIDVGAFGAPFRRPGPVAGVVPASGNPAARSSILPPMSGCRRPSHLFWQSTRNAGAAFKRQSVGNREQPRSAIDPLAQPRELQVRAGKSQYLRSEESQWQTKILRLHIWTMW